MLLQNKIFFGNSLQDLENYFLLYVDSIWSQILLQPHVSQLTRQCSKYTYIQHMCVITTTVLWRAMVLKLAAKRQNVIIHGRPAKKCMYVRRLYVWTFFLCIYKNQLYVLHIVKKKKKTNTNNTKTKNEQRKQKRKTQHRKQCVRGVVVNKKK